MQAEITAFGLTSNYYLYAPHTFCKKICPMPMNGLPNETELVVAFKNGDVVCFEQIYKHYWFSLYSIAVKKTGSQHDAEEMVQALFEKIWRNRENLIVNNLGAYLTVSLQHLMIDSFRKKSAESNFLKSYQIEAAVNNTDEAIEHQQLQNKIEEALNTLPSKSQTVFRMSRYENRSVKEIAKEMSFTEKAVEYHITKSIKHIKDFLKGLASWLL